MRIKMIVGLLETAFGDFFKLFFPPECAACRSVLLKQECHICTTCLYNMPRTNFHLDHDNFMAQIFWGRVEIENAAALYYFEKASKCRTVLHQIKYRGNKELAFYLGTIYGSELSRAGMFTGTDAIIPVPLHLSREKKRGFNQSEWFARGLAEILGKPVFNQVLIRYVGTDTQTRKSRIERWDNVSDSFRVNDGTCIENKHILLIDDVVTTGATLESCARALLERPGVKVSILTLAYA
jgi:ComF family protein